MSIVWTPSLEAAASEAAAKENVLVPQIKKIWVDSANFLSGRLGGDPQIHIENVSKPGFAQSMDPQVLMDLSIFIAQNNDCVRTQCEAMGVTIPPKPQPEVKKSFIDSVLDASATAEKYAGMPFYGAGYGVGYGVTMAARPVIDLLELVPIVGNVVSGARDGAMKAEQHYQVCTGKAKEWLGQAKEMLKPQPEANTAKA